MSRQPHGGGWAAVKYALDVADRIGWLKLWKAMRGRNACKTCALGMGGQLGGMRNESGHWPEVCKKSLQAMASDMQDGLRPEFFARYSLDELCSLSSRELESAGRIVTPLYAGPGDTHYRVIAWDKALSNVAAKLRAAPPARSFFYLSGRSSNEAGFLLQLFARLYGTNHINNCSYYCHQASGEGLGAAIGSGTATVSLEDVENTDLFILIGGNPASNHPRLMRTLMTIRRRGGHVMVINPARESGLVNFRVPSDLRSLLFGTEIAGDYLQPHIGGDIALLTGMARRLIERGVVNHAFISESTEGWEDFRAAVEQADWNEITRDSGLTRDQIERAADRYADAKSAVFAWTMGVTHHLHGVDNVRMIVNLALLRGMIGRPHAGLLPIRGHSNVQGIGSVGVTPRLRDVIFQKLQARCGISLPTFKGYDTMACMEAAGRGEMKFGFCLGGNLFGANPDALASQSALGVVDTLVYLNTTLNTGHVHGRGRETFLLPVLARDEESQPTTQESMFSYVRFSEGGEARHEGPRSEVDVIARVARHVLGDGGPVNWQGMTSHQTIRHWIADVIPGYADLADIDRTRREFSVAGRILHQPRFPTRSGKAQFKSVTIPRSQLAENEMRLMTVRSEGQFNTVVYEEADLYRSQDRRDVILMNPADMKRLNLAEDQPVVVTGAVAAMHGIRARSFDIRAGNALMYYPEANQLVPRSVDPQSGTPAFKNCIVTVQPEAICNWESEDRMSLSVMPERAERRLNAC